LRITIAAIGRLKAGPEKLLAADYLERARGLGRNCGIARMEVAEFAESQASSANSRMAAEAQQLLGAVAPKSFNVVLDERGKSMPSVAFADLLRRHLDQGTPEFSFLIGGPDGHDQSVRQSAGLVMSFGPMTWPHRLVRVMLLEQLYRALTIAAGHPYHRA
jgi:23S rRNA (pseudouridine1915-N3)-methyltransferase